VKKELAPKKYDQLMVLECQEQKGIRRERVVVSSGTHLQAAAVWLFEYTVSN
jgi:hypothetical protein